MASFTVSIKSSYLDKNHKAVVVLRYSHDYKSFVINTGIKVDPEYIKCLYDPDFEQWKFIGARLLRPTEKKALQEVSDELRQACAHLKGVLADLKSRGITPVVDHVKQEYNKTSFEKTEISGKSMMTWYAEYIAIKEREVGDGINSYRSTFNHMNDFVTDKGVVLLTDVTKDFLEKFRKHLLSRDLASTTIHKQFKNLRFFLNWIANEDEAGIIRIPKAYKKYQVKARYGDPIGLSVEQFFELYNLNLSGRLNLERTRDLFVFGVSIGGPRHGDLRRMAEAMARSGFQLNSNTITYFENKTGNSHYEIALNSFGIEILEKYKNILPSVPCNQVMNRHLLSIAKLLEWNDIKTIPKYDTFGKIVSVKEVQLKDLFSTKFMRKTAATIDNMLGVPTKTAMKRTGHKTFAAYSRYVDVNRESMAQVNQQWDKLKTLKSEQSIAVMKVS